MKDLDITKKWIKFLFKPFVKNILIIVLCTIIIIICGFISPFITKNIVDKGILLKDVNSILYYLICSLLAYVIQYFAELLQFVFYKPICVEIPNKLNEMAWTHVLKIRIKYFKERNFSEILAENMQDIGNISSLIDLNFLTSIVYLVKIIAGFAALIYISPYLAIILVFVSPIKLVLNKKFYIKKVEINKDLLYKQTKFSKWIGDCVSGILEIKMWDIVEDKKMELNDILRMFKLIRNKLLNLGFIEAFLSSLLIIMANTGIYMVGGILVIRGKLTLGGLLAFISYSSFVFEPLEIVSGILNKLAVVNPSVYRFDKFMNTEIEEDSIRDINLKKDFSIESLKFEKINFSYENNVKILNNLSFTIKKNEIVGLVGNNGSGKSSIINLLTRFYDSYDGAIMINNFNIKNIKIKSYRKILALMSQNNYIFNDTIANNINITNKLEGEQIKLYGELSGLDKSIQGISEKYNYIVGFNGQKLSGGQRQKLSMARVLSKTDAKILILDEATSNYDISSSNNLINSIIDNNNYDIVIIITHQPEILKKLKRLIFIKDGKVYADGNYDELIINEEFKIMIDKNKSK